MSKLPEKVYFHPNGNGIPTVPFTNSIEYIRADIAEKMVKEFAEFIGYNTKPFGGGKYRANKKYLTEADKIFSLDELFTEFKKQQP